MTPTETIGLVMEKMRKIVFSAIGAELAGFCFPSASNQAICPRRATITVAPGMVPLSISRLKASDMRCNRGCESPSTSGFAVGSGGVCGVAACLAAVCAVIFSPFTLIYLAGAVYSGAVQFWRRSGGLNRPPGRFALAIRQRPMLETARASGDARPAQECSSIGRAPVSKTGGRRFEPCHSCQLLPNNLKRLAEVPDPGHDRSQLLDERAAAILQRPERLVAGDLGEHPVVIPRRLRFVGLPDLEQEHRVHHAGTQSLAWRRRSLVRPLRRHSKLASGHPDQA